MTDQKIGKFIKATDFRISEVSFFVRLYDCNYFAQ